MAIDVNSPALDHPGHPGGRLFFQREVVGSDLVFREGIGIPEPPPLMLVVVAIGLRWLFAIRHVCSPARDVFHEHSRSRLQQF